MPRTNVFDQFDESETNIFDQFDNLEIDEEGAPKANNFVQPDSSNAYALPEPVEVDFSEPEDDSNFLGNVARGFVERGSQLVGSALRVGQVASDRLEEKLNLGGWIFDGGLPKYYSGDTYKAALEANGGQEPLGAAADFFTGLKTGYVPENTWESVKESFSDGIDASDIGKVFAYGAEQGIKSIPDMAAAVLSLPAYIVARSGEIGTERALNKGKTEADLTDVLEAAPFAIGSSLLERIGAGRMVNPEALGREVLEAGFSNAAKRIGKDSLESAGTEAVTEFVQEGMIEYVGEKFGTDAQMSIAESFDRGVGAAVAGGVIGGSIGASSSTAGEIFKPDASQSINQEAPESFNDVENPNAVEPFQGPLPTGPVADAENIQASMANAETVDDIVSIADAEIDTGINRVEFVDDNSSVVEPGHLENIFNQFDEEIEQSNQASNLANVFDQFDAEESQQAQLQLGEVSNSKAEPLLPAQGNTLEIEQNKVNNDNESVQLDNPVLPQDIEESLNPATTENDINTDIDARANEAATSPTNDLTEPTAEEKETGFYPKGHVNIHGLDISIENPKGSTRKGTDPDGNNWEIELQHHYGELDGTTGSDGDPIDVFIGSNPESEKVFVIDQVNQDGTYDEAKVMMSFTSKMDALTSYKSNYQEGFQVGPVTEMTIPEFQEWAKSDDTTKPLSANLRVEIESIDANGNTNGNANEDTTIEQNTGITSENSNSDAAGVPLNQIKVTQQFEHENGLSDIEIEQSADVALTQVDARIKSLQSGQNIDAEDTQDINLLAENNGGDKTLARKELLAEAVTERAEIISQIEEQGGIDPVKATEVELNRNLPTILSQTKTRYIRRELKETGINKSSPDYNQTVDNLNQQYEEDYDKALSTLSFEEFNQINNDKNKSVNRRDYELLVEEFSQADNLVDNLDTQQENTAGIDNVALVEDENQTINTSILDSTKPEITAVPIQNNEVSNSQDKENNQQNSNTKVASFNEEQSVITEVTSSADNTNNNATVGNNGSVSSSQVKPLPVKAVQRAVNTIGVRLRIGGIKTKVVASEAHLPKEIKAQITKEGSPSGISAAFHNKQIYIVADKMESESQIEEAILHESAHNGGRVLFGRGIVPAYNKLILSLGGVQGLKDKAIKAGFNMDEYLKIANESVKSGQMTDNQKYAYLVDEFLAHLNSQKAYDGLTSKVKNVIQEFYGAFRSMLRELKLLQLEKFGDSDLANLLKRINQASRDGVKNSNGDPLYMRNDKNELSTDSITDSASESSIENNPLFSRTKEAKSEFIKENRKIREQNKTLWKKAKTVLRQQLSPGGLLPDSVFKEKISRDSQFEVVEFDIKHLIGELERAIKLDYITHAGKLSDGMKEMISEALRGEISPELKERTEVIVVAMRAYIDKQSEQYRAILMDQFKNQVSEFNEGENILLEAYLKATGIEPESSTTAHRAEARKKREAILNTAKGKAKDIMDGDINMAESMTKVSDAAESSLLMGTILSNEGKYIHRSFQAFDDPKWFKKVSDDVLNNAREYLINSYENKDIEPVEAKRLAEVMLHEILKNGTAYDGLESFIQESKLGAKDLSVLKKRKQISPEILALLGEYKDPRLNFAKTATKMGRLIWNSHFLDRVREIGMGDFLFKGTDRPPEATAQIAGNDNDSFAPLNGLWTTPEVNQAFHDALGKEQMAAWYKKMIQINGSVKFGKTVLSPTTAMRNWQSALFFTVANGHFDLSHMKKSISGVSEYFKHAGEGEKLAYLRRLKELGVVYDTPFAGEMMRLLDDSNLENILSNSGTAMTAKSALNFAQKFYQFGDDFWKIIGYENEKQMLIKHAGLSESEAEIESAERIRNTYPTYSMVGRGVQSLRRFPLAGTFVSFPSEIIRTSLNMLRYLAKDMKNPKTRPMAKRRAAGLAIASGYTYALAEMSKALFDIDDEDEEAVRLQAAPWQKNSNLIFTGRDDKGNLRYIDISFIDPYNYWKRPINAIMRNQPWEEEAASAMTELVSPFLGTDILAGTLFEIAANKKESGGEIYKETDSPDRQLIDIASHLKKSVQPGIASNLERTWNALKGKKSTSGREYNLHDEILGWLGWRVSTLDPKTALYYRSYDFKDAKSDATRTLTQVLRDTNDIAPGAIAEAYERTLKMRAQAYKEMSVLIKAASRSGMNNIAIAQVLRGSLISKADVEALLNDEVPTWLPSRASERNAVKRAEAILGQEQVQVIQKRYAEATRVGEKLQPEEAEF